MKQNDKPSLIRKFRIWTRLYEGEIGRILSILFVLLCIIACIATYRECGHEINNYDISNYEYLTNLIDGIWDKDAKILNVADLPDNVTIKGAQFSSLETDFKCFLENGNILITDPFIEVHSSDNSDIEITYYTESEYVGSARADFVLFCILLCVLCLFTEIAVWWLIKLAIYLFCGICDFVRLFITEIQKA